MCTLDLRPAFWHGVGLCACVLWLAACDGAEKQGQKKGGAPVNPETLQDSGTSSPTGDSDQPKLPAPAGELEAFATAAAALPQAATNRRYLSLAHLIKRGASADELNAVRKAVSKLLNSLSWQPELAKPVGIDGDDLVLAIDLSAYGWDAARWDTLTKEHPQPSDDTPGLAQLRTATGAKLPLIRADWFVAKGSVPPLYYALSAMPKDLPALEKAVGVDLQADVDAGKVIRAGFDDSAISTNHRIAERHGTKLGFLWRSYEFAAPAGDQDIFANPLGPAASRGLLGRLQQPARGRGAGVFATAGGELIFQLPNGLLGFYVAEVSGKRLDEIPPEKGKNLIVAGASCMGCHARGPITKNDQVVARVTAAGNLAEADLARVKALYVTSSAFTAAIDTDRAAFQAALAKLGITADDGDPVSSVRSRYFAEP